MVKNKSKFFLLLSIIVLALFLRLNNLPSSIEFAWDQERDAFAVKQILLEKKPILIGPRVINDRGFMLAPYFFYLLIPFYLITAFHPYATIVLIAVYSALFLIFSFLVLKKLFSERIAFIFIFLWSVLPLAVFMDTIPWNPLLVPLLFISLFYLFEKLNFDKLRNWILLGFYLGFSFNIHVQLAILSFTSFIFLLFKSPKIKIFKNTILLLLGFSISFLPLIIFDLRHDFLNLNLFLNFFKSTSLIREPLALIPVWTNFVSRIIPTTSLLLSILFYLFIAFTLFFLSKKNILNKFLLFTWLFFPIIFIIYGKRPSEYYFNFSLPIIVLALSQLISKIKMDKFLFFILMLLISVVSISLKLERNHVYAFSLANKINVVKYIKEKTADTKFNLSYSVSFGQNSGYEYLMDYFKVKPTNNPDDPLIEIIIPGQEQYRTFGDISIKLPYPFND